jgi:hypothetical protein
MDCTLDRKPRFGGAFLCLANDCYWPVAEAYLHIESDCQQSALPSEAAPQSGRLKALVSAAGIECGAVGQTPCGPSTG